LKPRYLYIGLAPHHPRLLKPSLGISSFANSAQSPEIQKVV
jgi:hypothetical protein